MKHFMKGFNFVCMILFIVFAFWGIFNAGTAVVIRELILPDAPGYYMEDLLFDYPINVLEGMIYAEDEWTLLHEGGHLMDKNFDHPSQSEAFIFSIAKFRTECHEGAWYNFPYEPACEWIFGDDSSNFFELYANIYRQYRYGMRFPTYITQFYRPDWKELVNLDAN